MAVTQSHQSVTVVFSEYYIYCQLSSSTSTSTVTTCCGEGIAGVSVYVCDRHLFQFTVLSMVNKVNVDNNDNIDDIDKHNRS